MDARYNLYNFEASFKEYLLAGNRGSASADRRPRTDEQSESGTGVKVIVNVTIKNYLSDFRHFMGWLTFYVQNAFVSSNKDFDISRPETIQIYLTNVVINDYKAYLMENNIPLKTINRRLSTVRKFCSFCISQGWMKDNPGKQIANIQSEAFHLDSDSKKALDQYRADLQQGDSNQHSIANTINDVEEFLHIISS